MPLILTTEKASVLKPAQLKIIAEALEKHLKLKGKCEAFVAWVGLPQMRLLNRTWRGKDKPTNVLSYPQYEPDELPGALKNLGKHGSLHIGDIVLCLPYVKNEAKAEKKPLNDHLTHLVVHGVLHLLGYDHIKARMANTMETLEKKILASLDIPDPYVLPALKPKKRPKKKS